MSKVGYRPDIDGLRAVAVTLVLLFHAGLGVTGGFVGVDVFFVISGYLITGLILRDLSAGTFSLADFWVRRIRRIVPASCIMVLVTLAFAALWLSPADYKELGKSAIAQPLMGANVFFWVRTGYFDGPADMKPLLHTWSLAVEEQFYVIFPLLLAVLWKLPRRWMIAALTFIAAASFSVSLWQVETSPSAAFFLLPGRAWEMLLGGLLWFLPSPERRHVRWIRLMGLAGVIGVMLPAVTYSSSTAFPGWTAVLPCLGTALIIYAGGHQDSWLGTCLSWRPLVQVGQMSYSLYLWHWPILVLLRYRQGVELSLVERLLVVAGSFVAGWLSWQLVENPFRYGAIWRQRRTVFASFAAATGVVLVCGLILQETRGLPQRFSAELQQVYETMEAPRHQHFVLIDDVVGNRLPEFGDKAGAVKCLLWGDSHAMALVPALDESCRELGIHCFQATYGATLPLVDFAVDRDGSAPEEYDEAVIDRVFQNDYDVVILAGYWSRDSDHPDFVPALKETVERLTATGARIVILRDVPTQEGSTGALTAAPLRRGSGFDDLGVTLDEHRERQEIADAAFEDLDPYCVTVVDPTPYFLDAAHRCRIVMDGECLYSDEHHLSLAGARRLIPLFTDLLDDLPPPLMDRAAMDGTAKR